MDLYYLERKHPIPLEELVSLEALENYTEFRMYNGKKIISSTTLKKHQEKITANLFIRVNRQVIVNLRYVEQYLLDNGTYYIKLKDGRLIKISRRRQRLVLATAS